ncbi:MAG TPA: putative photosynthetic complex assembly protein PuhE [Rubrivivax sp.]
MSGIALPVLFAVFVWWFSTGVVLLLDGLPRTTFRWSHLLSTLLAAGAFVGLAHTAAQTTPAGAYCAFTCALLLWGWHELSFLTGWVTGPRKQRATPGARGSARFVQAVQAILWHELAILASGLVLVALTWGEPNQVGTATFVVLWLMRISAKLNVFLGVRNLSTELLPPHLAYLGSYFRRRPMNLLFPLVVTAATAVAVLMAAQALGHPGASAGAAGGLLVTTLLVLGILEHWLLVLPLEATALWRWAMRDKTRPAQPRQPFSLESEVDESLSHAR